jgi:hypothetical protein
MFIWMKNNQKISSRQQINITGIEDNLLHLTNHRYRAIIKISTINFELKSEQEKDIISNNYQSFLNSLPGTIQIYIQVRELDLQTYTTNFRSSIKQYETYTKYKNQINDYINFVNTLTKKNQILTRNFYLIIPFNDYLQDYQAAKEKINIDCDIIRKNLHKMKLNSTRLNNLQIFNLFYEIYNPDIHQIQKLNQNLIKQMKEGLL